MGSSESKPSSIILGILALGLIILILCFIKAKCSKMFNQPGAEYGFNPWIQMARLGNNLAPVGGLPYTPPVREIPETTSPNQLALTSALSRIHNKRSARLQIYP